MRADKETVERCRRFGDVAAGVVFHWELASCDGASFVLFREPHHTDEDIARAKRYLYNERDVVSLSVQKVEEGANE